jgi:hypothetical protein
MSINFDAPAFKCEMRYAAVLYDPASRVFNFIVLTDIGAAKGARATERAGGEDR